MITAMDCYLLLRYVKWYSTLLLFDVELFAFAMECYGKLAVNVFKCHEIMSYVVHFFEIVSFAIAFCFTF